MLQGEKFAMFLGRQVNLPWPRIRSTTHITLGDCVVIPNPWRVFGTRCPCHHQFFPDCVAKGSRVTFGVWGVEACSLDAAFCVQAVATVVTTTAVKALWPRLWGVPGVHAAIENSLGAFHR